MKIFFIIFIFTNISQILQATQVVIDSTNETEVLLDTTNNILSAQKHVYKNQLFSSIQILDMGKLALLKHNILTQVQKYNSLRIFNVHDNFKSRKDLHAEYFFSKRPISFPACEQLCLSKDSVLISSIIHYNDLKKYIPRNLASFWVKTVQKAKESEPFKAHYDIYFNGYKLETEHKEINNASCPRYFFLNQNQTVQEIVHGNLAPTLKYYDALTQKYWAKNYPQLQVKFDLEGNIKIYYPTSLNGIYHPEYLSQCICARSLQTNYFKLKRSQHIVNDANLLLQNLPLKLEQSRIMPFNQQDKNISVQNILKNNGTIISSIIDPSGILDIRRLKNIYLEPSNSTNYHDIRHLEETIKYLSLLKNIPIHQNISFEQKIPSFEENKGTRQRRLSLNILKNIPFGSILSKIIKIGSPYLLRQYKPFHHLKQALHSYHEVRRNPAHLKMEFATNLSNHQALKIHHKNNIFTLEHQENFDQVNSITTPGLFQANELYRAAFLLNYTYKKVMASLPHQIFQLLKKYIKIPIHNVKAKIQQENSLLFIHYIFEGQILNNKIEEFTFRSFPLLKKNENEYKYEVPSQYSPLLEEYKNTMNICLNSLIYGHENDIQRTCSLTKIQNEEIIKYLYSNENKEYLLIKGPSKVRHKCLNHPSRYFEIKTQYAVVALGGGCQIQINYQNLKGKYEAQPLTKLSAYFKVLHQYNLQSEWSSEQIHTIAVIFTIIVVFTLIGFLCFYAAYIHHKYKFTFTKSLSPLENEDVAALPQQTALAATNAHQ